MISGSNIHVCLFCFIINGTKRISHSNDQLNFSRSPVTTPAVHNIVSYIELTNLKTPEDCDGLDQESSRGPHLPPWCLTPLCC